jgi:glutathione reductase (NADPH)
MSPFAWETIRLIVDTSCVPKKLVWHAADIAEKIHQSKGYGFSVKEEAPFNWYEFKQKRDAYITRLNGIYDRNIANDKAELVHGRAKFLSKNEVEIKLDDGSKQRVKGKHILIATGGHPTIPKDIPGAELGITSDGFFELEQQPKRVAIVGAGYIAVEFAGMFNALGTETHLFIRHDNFLRSFDPTIQEKLAIEYERQGIHIHKNSSPSKVEDVGNGVKKLHYKDSKGEGTLDVDTVIWAIGRTAENEDLGLENTGVKTNEKGHIIVDEFQNTNVENIYAVGDVCDQGFELTPVAIAAGRRLVDRIFGGQKDRRLEYSNIPSVIFAHPEAGSIGLTEPEARKKYGDDLKIYNSGFISLYNSMLQPEEKTKSTYKLICQGPNEKVVGLHIIGENSGEILQGFGVAIKMGATKADFDSCVAIHPTSAEEIVTLK